MDFPHAQRQSLSSCFCTLEYRASRLDPAAPASGPVLVILLVVAGELSVMVHPDWRSFVDIEDQVEIEALFADWVERAKGYPEGLLQHASGLNCGCLVTSSVGIDIDTDPATTQLLVQFARLEEIASL